MQRRTGAEQGPQRAPHRGAAPAGDAVGAPDAGLLARRLYRATLDHLRRSADPCGERHLLLAPLSAALAIQKTRAGVACCAALNAALVNGDYEAALDACVALVDIAVELRGAEDLG